jgi:hypothetical protein
MSARYTTIPGPLFREFQDQVGAEFLHELERAITNGETTEEELQMLAEIAGFESGAA